MTKTVTWIIVAVIIVGGGIWWWVASMGNNAGVGPAAANPNSATATSTASAPLPEGTSDQAIDQEMLSINAQMNGLSSDSANISQSLSDQPIQQVQ